MSVAEVIVAILLGTVLTAGLLGMVAWRMNRGWWHQHDKEMEESERKFKEMEQRIIRKHSRGIRQ